jgi:hypothetical protein
VVGSRKSSSDCMLTHTPRGGGLGADIQQGICSKKITNGWPRRPGSVVERGFREVGGRSPKHVAVVLCAGGTGSDPRT